MRIGTACPVWQEQRYLPLVLEQMVRCPGPKIVLWQDQPLHWLGEGHAPSGHQSRVKDILAQFPEVEVILMDRAPDDGIYGGFKNLGEMGFALLKERDADLVVWQDSDWIFDLDEIDQFYTDLVKSETPIRWAVNARHYWRDFYHTMATGGITVAFPVDVGLFDVYTEADIRRTPYMCYHPAYVMPDEEMYLKVHSWGHAPLFKERGFYEKEWLGKDDSLIKPQPADVLPSPAVVRRLHNWGAIEVLKDFYA